MFGLFNKKMAGFGQLGVDTDWHCHLLPGVDDGVQNLSDSAQILLSMKKKGITKIVHTPHFNAEIFPGNTEQKIKREFKKYIEALPEECKEGMDLRLGGEYMILNGFEDRKIKNLLQIDDGKVLIEMSYMYPSANIEESIFSIVMAGLTPVIAHPERYLYYAGKLETFDRFHDMGAEFQLNLLSLTGCYGPASVHILEYILKKEMYSYVGTDTHTPHHFSSISNMEIPQKYIEALSYIRNK